MKQPLKGGSDQLETNLGDLMVEKEEYCTLGKD